MKIKEHELLAAHTYFNIGGPARFFVEVNHVDDIVEAVNFAEKKNLKWFVISGGSNILVADEGYDGVFIRMCTKDILVEGESIEAASGVSMAALVASAIGNGLAGCEWAIGIPGMVGGSVRGNAGCFGGEVADAIESVKIYNTRQKCFDELSNKECNFDYRESMFKKYPELVIVSAKFKLEKDTGGARKRMLDFIEERNQKQAIGTKSAGCIFKNPKNNSAGRVIDEIGCKGLRIGDAEVSRQHANFIINNNNATAKDILLLIEKIKQKIKQEKNITLQEEIVFVK